MKQRIHAGYIAGIGYDNTSSTSAADSEKAEDRSFTQTLWEKYSLSPKDMTLAEYKLYIHEKIKRLYTHPSQKRLDWFIDISDAAYRRMQKDPAYEQWVLDFVAGIKSTGYGYCVPRFGLIHIDDTREKCYGYTYGYQDDDRARRAAARRRLKARQAEKERRKKLLKEYLKKKAQAKRLQEQLLKAKHTKQLLEHARLLKTWNEDRQRAQVSRAYEASLLMLARREQQIASRSPY
ncbi:hypothetical protein IMSAGC003_02632 [Lachnospiraceae bacterium]|nr:hypothetical protein [Acetatifactor sp.]GFH96079.1 hypothetical protein IMSAGC003_02632 [Lachnospiraceae bacterium]